MGKAPPWPKAPPAPNCPTIPPIPEPRDSMAASVSCCCVAWAWVKAACRFDWKLAANWALRFISFSLTLTAFLLAACCCWSSLVETSSSFNLATARDSPLWRANSAVVRPIASEANEDPRTRLRARFSLRFPTVFLCSRKDCRLIVLRSLPPARSNFCLKLFSFLASVENSRDSLRTCLLRLGDDVIVAEPCSSPPLSNSPLRPPPLKVTIGTPPKPGRSPPARQRVNDATHHAFPS